LFNRSGPRSPNRPSSSQPPPAENPRPTKPTKAIIAGVAAQTSGAVPISLIGATAPELQAAFDFGDAELGIIAALYFMLAAVLGPYGGRIVDRLGPAIGIRATGLLGAAGLLAEALAQSYSMLIAGALVGAVALAIATPASNVALVHHVPERHRGLAFGLKQSAVPLAAALSGLALPLIALRAGWRWAFVVMLLFPLVSMLTAPQTPIDHQPSKERTTARSRPPRNLYLLAGVGTFAAAAVGTLNSFLVRAGVEAGFSKGSAGVLLSVAAASLIVSRVMWGAILDRSRIDPIALMFFLLAVGAAGYALLGTSQVVLFAVGAVIAYSFGWAWPGVQFLAGVRLWPENPGEASGLLQTGAFIGVSTGPLAFGFLVERSGFGVGYTAVAGVAAIAAVLAGLLARLRRAQDAAIVPG